MKTVNEILATIETFNNAAIQEVGFTKWHTLIKFEATDFAAAGINEELKSIGIKAEKLDYSNAYILCTTLPHVA